MLSEGNRKYTIGAGVVVGLGLLWYLSNDGKGKSDGVDLSQDKYSLENLKAVLGELELEFTCIYARVYNLMQKLKENQHKGGTPWTDDLLRQLEASVHEDRDMKTKQVIEQNQNLNLTPELLGEWVEKHKDDHEIKTQADNLVRMHKEVFTDQFLQRINFVNGIPSNMTGEMYMRIYNKIWATIRHELYEAIEAKKKEINCNANLPQKEFAECYNESHKMFESVRLDIYELLMEEKIQNQSEARRIMQKAYVTYATIPTGSSGKTLNEPERSRWADQVNAAASKHSKYIQEFEKGIFPTNIKADPRLTQDADEKVDISSLPLYEDNKVLRKQKTTSLQKDDNEMVKQPIGQKASNQISGYVERFRERQKKQKDEEEKNPSSKPAQEKEENPEKKMVPLGQSDDEDNEPRFEEVVEEAVVDILKEKVQEEEQAEKQPEPQVEKEVETLKKDDPVAEQVKPEEAAAEGEEKTLVVDDEPKTSAAEEEGKPEAKANEGDAENAKSANDDKEEDKPKEIE